MLGRAAVESQNPGVMTTMIRMMAAAGGTSAGVTVAGVTGMRTGMTIRTTATMTAMMTAGVAVAGGVGAETAMTMTAADGATGGGIVTMTIAAGCALYEPNALLNHVLCVAPDGKITIACMGQNPAQFRTRVQNAPDLDQYRVGWG